jgi:hypothetical protein
LNTPRQTAALINRDKVSLERIGVPAAAAVGKILAAQVSAAFNDHASQATISAMIGRYMARVEPIILDSMVAGHLSGRARAIKLSAQGLAGHRKALSAYDDALSYYQKRMKLTPEDIEKLRKLYGQKALSVTKSASDLVDRRATAAIQESIEKGEHIRDAMARLKGAFESAGIVEPSPFLCETLVRSNLGAAYTAGEWQALRDPELAEVHAGFLYVCTGDNRVRPEHLEWDYFTGPKDDPFWQTHYPLCGWNCVPGETLVRGNVQHALKTRYSGPLVVIETAMGNKLSITPNHPILTADGWVPANKIGEGQTLFSYNRPTDGLLGNERTNQDAPARIEDVFQSFTPNGSASARTLARKLSALDLHGDARFCDGKINVVGANRILPLKRAPQPFHQYQLAVGSDAASALIPIHTLRGFDAGFQASSASASSIMRGLDLMGALIGRHLRPLQTLRIGLSADFDSLPFKPLNDSPMNSANAISDTLGAFFAKIPLLNRLANPHAIYRLLADHNIFAMKPTVKSYGLHSKFLSQLTAAFSGAVSADKVANVKMINFTGHVYDLQTVPGYYIAQGIVISNCRCTAIPTFSETESNIPAAYGPADEGDNPVTGLPWGTPPPDDMDDGLQ